MWTSCIWRVRSNIRYLNIEQDGKFCGYFILGNEPETDSVEFRRILLDKDARGVGQLAIIEMEDYCQREFNMNRIWLDVYADNAIGIHIYEKLGYRKFDETLHEGRPLYFYQKYFT